MINNLIKLPITLISDQNESTSGSVEVQYYSQKSRSLRSFKWLGILWGLSLVSVLIPLAHFILVPGFFIAGLTVALVIYPVKQIIIRGEATCPYCHKSFPIARMKITEDLSDKCSHCLRSSSLILKENVSSDD